MRRRQQKPIAAGPLSRGRRHCQWARTGLAGIAICLILAPGRPKADDGLPSVTVNAGSPGQAAAGPNGASEQQATYAPSGMGSPQQIQPAQAGPESANAIE